jgi:hypothetical protein
MAITIPLDRNQIGTTLNIFIAAWNADTEQYRRNLLQYSFAPNGIYIDPDLGKLKGIDSMYQAIAEFREKFPHRLETTGKLDTHHNIFRISWRFYAPAFGVLSQGTFVGELDKEGQIIRLFVF